MSRLSTTAQVLRLLGSGESTPLDGNIELLRSVLRISAEACERLDETDRRFSQALLRIADLEALLARVVEVLETAPLPVDGGSWVVLELTQEVHAPWRRILMSRIEEAAGDLAASGPKRRATPDPSAGAGTGRR